MPDPSPVPTFHHKVYPSIDPTNPELSVKGKVVVVTGGGTGIGAATAEAFADAGAAHVAILGRRVTALEKAKATIEQRPNNSTKIHVFQADITDAERLATVFSTVASTIGRVDVLVANAGFFVGQGPLVDLAAADLKAALDINLTGTLLTIQEFLKVKADGPTTVISVNSAAATMEWLAVPTYVISKWATVKLIEGFAAEHSDVRFFSLQPGVIATEMSAQVGADKIANDDVALPGAFSVWLASAKSEILRGSFLWANWDVDELLQLTPTIEKNPKYLKVGVVGQPDWKHNAPSVFESVNDLFK